MGGLFEIQKGVAGKSKQKSADIAAQTGYFRRAPAESVQTEKNTVVDHSGSQAEYTVQDQVVQPGESKTERPVYFTDKSPHYAHSPFA